jgi:hypothetical protein
VLPTVAVLVFDDDQVPPDAVFDSVVVAPTITVDAPVIVPAFGAGFTLRVVVVLQPVDNV